MNGSRALIFCVLLGLAASAQAGATAPALAPAGKPSTPDPEDAHYDAVEQLLAALALPALVRHDMRHQPSLPADQQDVLQHLSDHTDDEGIIANLAPVYVRYLSTRDAGRLAAHYRSAAGRKRVAAMLAQAGVADGDSNPVYTGAEALEIAKADALPGARALRANAAAIKQQQRDVILNWGTNHKRLLQRQADSTLQAVLRAALQSKGDGTPPNIAANPTGLASLDKRTTLAVDHYLRSVALDAALREDLQAYDFEHVLDPERMLSKEGLALSRRSLARSEERMERYLRERQENVQRFWEQFKLAVADPSAPAYLEPTMENALALQVRTVEVARSTLGTFSRILSFFESRLGTITMRDGVRVFKDEHDLQLFLTLSSQLEKAQTDGNEVQSERLQRIEAAIDPARR